jgi:hypothetical protein
MLAFFPIAVVFLPGKWQVFDYGLVPLPPFLLLILFLVAASIPLFFAVLFLYLSRAGSVTLSHLLPLVPVFDFGRLLQPFLSIDELVWTVVE